MLFKTKSSSKTKYTWCNLSYFFRYICRISDILINMHQYFDKTELNPSMAPCAWSAFLLDLQNKSLINNKSTCMHVSAKLRPSLLCWPFKVIDFKWSTEHLHLHLISKHLLNRLNRKAFSLTTNQIKSKYVVFGRVYLVLAGFPWQWVLWQIWALYLTPKIGRGRTTRYFPGITHPAAKKIFCSICFLQKLSRTDKLSKKTHWKTLQ